MTIKATPLSPDGLTYPRSVKEVQEATNSQIYKWKHYNCKGYLDFIIDIALTHEYDKRF